MDINEKPIPMKVFLCGITTGIPLCCIAWYSGGWHLLDKEARAAHWPDSEEMIKRLQYIPCPECIKNKNFVNVWYCQADADCRVCLTGGFRERIIKPRKHGMRRASELKVVKVSILRSTI